MKTQVRGPLLAVLLSMPAVAVKAQTATAPGVSPIDVIEVTATRFSEPVQELPNSIEVISGDDLRARGVNDLRTALALVGGVSVAPGGDEGPAGSLPGLLGTREADDLLLVIDGVPAGGAFIPQFATLDLHDVERIEVQRGPAPVIYGTTSFAGTINIIHYAAGEADTHAAASYGSFGSMSVDGATVISAGALRQSVSADLERDRYSDPRSGADRAHLLYRVGATVAGGDARLDFETTIQHQKPSSPRPLDGSSFDPTVPIDFNQNPADGKIDTNRFQLTGNFDKNLRLGSWGSTLSVTQTHTQLVQGFLNTDDGGDDDDAVVLDDGPNATGFHQQRDLTEVFFDTHITHHFGHAVLTTFGANELFGLAHQSSQTFSYTVPDDGSLPPSSGEGTPTDSLSLSDNRSFGGIYTQTRWNLTPDIGLLAGLRLSRADERRVSGDSDDSQTQNAATTRFSGSLGGNWRVWQDKEGDLDDVVIYASYANTFQPPQIDFGPDDQGEPLLSPETEDSFEGGIKLDGFDGRFSADLGGFYVDFKNQAFATEIDGTPALTSGGRERYIGLELETSYKILPKLSATTNYSYNDASFRSYQTVIDDANVQLAGKQLPLSPHGLAGAGLVYGGGAGVLASVTGNFVGNRYLDMPNTIGAKAYATVDATLGYRFRRYSATFAGYNLSNRRDPVSSSELGDGQFYLVQGRRLFLRLALAL